MRRFIPLQHVQLPPRDLAVAHSRLAVLGDVFARRGLVVDAVPSFQRAGGDPYVGEDEVEAQEEGAVVWDGEGGCGAEAEVLEEGGHCLGFGLSRYWCYGCFWVRV